MKFLNIIAILSPLFGIAQQQVNQQKIKNIAAFTRLYGYVRYFHPSDEAAQLNWEDFVYYGIRDVENEKTVEGLTSKLNRLFNPIAPSVLITTQKASRFYVKNIKPPGAVEMKDVFWQHQGFGFGSNKTYKSIRVNGANQLNGQEAEVPIATQRIDPKPYRGKSFRLRSFFKVGGSAEGLLFINIRNADTSSFFRNMNDDPATSNTWKEYEITGTIPAKAENLTVGIFVRGHGKAWVDNVVFEVEDQGIWTRVELLNHSFEDPSLKSDVWRMKPEGRFELVKRGEDDDKQALLLKNDVEDGRMIFDLRPKFGEYVKKDIGLGITCIIPLVLMTKDQKTYPFSAGNQLKILADSIYQFVPSEKTATNLHIRLSGVAIAWNIFKHFYPYHEEANTDWDEELVPALEAAYFAQTPDDYLLLLKHLTEKLKDGHIIVSRTRANFSYTIPAVATLAEDQLVIEKVAHNQTLLKVGDIVTHIDRKPILTLLAKLKSEISGSEQWKNYRAIIELFNGGMGTEVILTIKRDNEPEREVKLTRGRFELVNNQPDISKLNDDIYYINLGTTPMEDIESTKDLLMAKAIIFDLRGYPRNNIKVINYLLSSRDTCNWLFMPQIVRPDLKGLSYKPIGWQLKPEGTHLSCKVIFLTGGGAISQSESVMAYIKHHRLATIVGQPTAGANGDVNRFILPGNYTISFSGLKVRQHDGSQLHALGILPDVLVNRTIKGIKEERDEFLEKALEVLNGE